MSDRTLIALNGSAGVAALAGAWYALGGAPDVPTEWLDGSPCADYRVPGLILGGVYAPANLDAAWALWRRQSRASDIAVAVATLQVGWIGAQVSIIGVRSFPAVPFAREPRSVGLPGGRHAPGCAGGGRRDYAAGSTDALGALQRGVYRAPPSSRRTRRADRCAAPPNRRARLV